MQNRNQLPSETNSTLVGARSKSLRTDAHKRQKTGQDTIGNPTNPLNVTSSSSEQTGVQNGLPTEQAAGHYQSVGELVKQHHEQPNTDLGVTIPHPVESTGTIKSTHSVTRGGSSLRRLGRGKQDPSPLEGTRRATLKPKATDDIHIPGVQDMSSKSLHQEMGKDNKTRSPISDQTPQPVNEAPPDVSLEQSQSIPHTSGVDAEATVLDVDMDMASTSGTSNTYNLKERLPPRRLTIADVQHSDAILPSSMVFPIQIGAELFRLSGVSISSDAPSYFSQFFEDRLRQGQTADNLETLYIDRDPGTFRDICLHLQGYHIEPRDGTHFVRLFADAMFFSLPRLTQQLFQSAIYVRIGESDFQIPRDLFNNPGDSPNFFSLGFAIFFMAPSEVFPSLNQRTLLRPPSILPPHVPGRSARIFHDLLQFLKGYPLHIRDDQHRADLLRDARYFHLKGLEQKLIAHDISYNPVRQKTEITIRLEDIRQSGISFTSDSPNSSSASSTSASFSVPSLEPSDSTSSTSSSLRTGGWILYQRPFVDDTAYELVIEIGNDSTTLVELKPSPTADQATTGRAEFHGQNKARVTSLFQVISNKMNLPVDNQLGVMMLERGAGIASLPVSPANSGISEHKVKVRIGDDAAVVLDGKTWPMTEERLWVEKEWTVSKGLWRIRMQPTKRGRMEAVLCAIKLEAFTSERGRNAKRTFL